MSVGKKKIKKPYCDCSITKDDKVGMVRVVDSSDGLTCDECGYYVTWREINTYLSSLTKSTSGENDYSEYKVLGLNIKL